MKKQPEPPSTWVTTKTYLKKYSLLIIAVVIVIVLGTTYELGYRIGPGLSIERVGFLTLTGLPKGTAIYVDQTLVRTTPKAGNFTKELTPGDHSVIVSVTGDYPWSSLPMITARKTTTQNPILLGMTPNATPLSGADKTAALAAIASTTLPTFADPITLANGCAVVYVSNNQIIAAAATTTPGCVPPPYLCVQGSCDPTIIYSPVTKLAAVVRYPYRQDALVIQLSNLVYAIALDPRTPQFFAPVLTATEPVLGTLPDGTLVIHNGTAVYKISL